MTRKTLVAVVVLSVSAAVAWSQPARADEPRRRFSSLLNVDSLIDNYARFLSRKYDLNEQQDAFTHELLKKKARVFLDRHETELKDLVDRMFDVRTGAEMSPDELVAWGQRIAPIYTEAKRAIVDGNHEWRVVLNPAQTKMHDADLALMEQSFAMTDDQLGRIVSGQMTVEEFRNPQRRRQQEHAPPPPPAQLDQPQPEFSQQHIDAETAAKEAADREAQAQAAMEAKLAEEKLSREREAMGQDAPPMDIPPNTPSEPQATPDKPTHRVITPPQAPPPHAPPSAGAAPPPPPPNPTAQRIHSKMAAARGGQNASEWENYVKQFIERYKLNPEQAEKANQVLKACQDQAESPRRTAERRGADLDLKIAALQGSKDPGAAAQLQKLNEEKAKLSEPITRIFERSLKPRLERIPTHAQRRDAEAAGNRGAAAPAAPGSATANNPPKPRRVAKPAPPPTGESSEDRATPTGKKRPDDE
ncbi:MAG: hypothetical protein AB7Q17_14905 [Phycisphaerae bacterium]